MMLRILAILISGLLLLPSWALAVMGTVTAAANPPSGSYSSVTVLPSSPTTGDIIIVTDDSVAGACDSNAGTATTLCYYNGTRWRKVGGGPTVLASSGIAFVKASTGSMGNNGAVTAMTALPRILTNGAWMWFPAGAVAAGVPASASWLWFVGSSTTAGTVYNSTYTSGQPTVGTTTAFATTGPGAFTGSTSTIAGPVITMPASLMGINGSVHLRTGFEANNTGGAKATYFKFGSAATTSLSSISTNLSGINDVVVTNRGITNVQEWGQFRHHESTVSSSGSTAAANLAVIPRRPWTSAYTSVRRSPLITIFLTIFTLKS